MRHVQNKSNFQSRMKTCRRLRPILRNCSSTVWKLASWEAVRGESVSGNVGGMNGWRGWEGVERGGAGDGMEGCWAGAPLSRKVPGKVTGIPGSVVPDVPRWN